MTDGFEAREPFDPANHDSRAEEAIKNYRHYMTIDVGYLVECYITRSMGSGAPEAMEQAIDYRMEEIQAFLRG